MGDPAAATFAVVMAFGFAVFLVWVGLLRGRADQQDDEHHRRCRVVGEVFVESNGDFALCEQDGGTIVRR